MLIQQVQTGQQSTRDVLELYSSQEETDTRIILHSMFVCRIALTDSTIIVKSPNVHVFILLPSYCEKIPQAALFETDIRNQQLLNVNIITKTNGKQTATKTKRSHVTSNPYTWRL